MNLNGKRKLEETENLVIDHVIDGRIGPDTRITLVTLLSALTHTHSTRLQLYPYELYDVT